MKKEEKEYLKIIHAINEKHGLQTKIFSMQPLAVKFDKFNFHCEQCSQILRSRPMYLMKRPGVNVLSIKYLCNYCAGLHEKYIVSLIITSN